MTFVSRTCVCGFSCEAYQTFVSHKKHCPKWQEQVGQCSECERRHYRHVPGCKHAAEDATRLQLLKRNGIDLGEFALVLKVLAERYRNITRMH
jgi:hypothetical protein